MNKERNYLKEYCKERLKIPYSKLTKKKKKAIEDTLRFSLFIMVKAVKEIVDTQTLKALCNPLKTKKLDKKKKKKNYKSL